MALDIFEKNSSLEDDAQLKQICEDCIANKNTGRVGKEINVSLDFSIFNNSKCLRLKTAELTALDGSVHEDELGLKLDSTNPFLITGIPKEVVKDGLPQKNIEVFLNIIYELIDDKEHHSEEVSRNLNILSILNPKAMFEVRDPESKEYETPHVDKNILLFDEKKGIFKSIVAASRRGRSHEHSGSYRDDNFKFEYLKDADWYVVVVSDGAGSAEYSRWGSKIVCESFCSYVKKYLQENETMKKKVSELVNAFEQSIPTEELETLKANMVTNLRSIAWRAGYEGFRAIDEEAKRKSQELEKNVESKKYAATLLGFLLKKFGTTWLVVSVYIGDGAIAMIMPDGNLVSLSIPDGGENVGETRFVTMRNVWGSNQEEYEKNLERRTKYAWVDDFKSIISMSDGVSDPKFGTDNNLKSKEIWNAFWNEVQNAASLQTANSESADKLLEWLHFYIESHHDDRTIAIVY